MTLISAKNVKLMKRIVFLKVCCLLVVPVMISAMEDNYDKIFDQVKKQVPVIEGVELPTAKEIHAVEPLHPSHRRFLETLGNRDFEGYEPLRAQGGENSLLAQKKEDAHRSGVGGEWVPFCVQEGDLWFIRVDTGEARIFIRSVEKEEYIYTLDEGEDALPSLLHLMQTLWSDLNLEIG